MPETDTSGLKSFTRARLQQSAIEALDKIRKELKRRDELLTPQNYGFPDLLSDKYTKKKEEESEEELIERQEQVIYNFVKENLYLLEDGKPHYVDLLPKARELVADFFYGRVSAGILWKSRGGGGSTTAAVLIYLLMVYKKKEFTNLAGSGSQARSIYEKVVQFCHCNNLVTQYLLIDTLLSRTEFNNGAKLHCINATDRQVRSRHDSGLIVDEGCQEKDKSGEVMKTALQNALTQPNHVILVLSTFHHPEGFFQEYWDYAEKFGFKRYKWDIFDCMEKCDKAIDCKECYLTREIKERDENGKVIGVKYGGCNGKARNSEGFKTYESVVKIKKANSGSNDDTFYVEYECSRPSFYGSIYDIDSLNDAEWRDIDYYESDKVEMSVGIDWGYVGQTCVSIAARTPIGVAILECGWFTESQVEEILDYLNELKDKYGKFIIYADSSDPFNNRELLERGYRVFPVAFKKWKDFGIRNIRKFLDTGRLQFNIDGYGIDELLSQLRKYRANPKTGKPIKRDDHGPDSIMCAMMNFRFFELFGESPNLRKSHPEMYEENSRKSGEIGDKEEVDEEGEVLLF